MTQRRQPFSATEFATLYSQVPRVTVEVVLPTPTGVVLVKRQEKSWHGCWHIPGGTILYKESVTVAVQRVASEELGVQVSVGQLLGYIEYPSEEQERGFGYSVGLAFQCYLQTEVNTQLWEAQGIQCFTTVPEQLIEEQRPLLEKVLSTYQQ